MGQTDRLDAATGCEDLGLGLGPCVGCGRESIPRIGWIGWN